MLEPDDNSTPTTPAADPAEQPTAKAPRKRAAKKTTEAPAAKKAAKATAKKTAKKTANKAAARAEAAGADAADVPAAKTARKRAAKAGEVAASSAATSPATSAATNGGTDASGSGAARPAMAAPGVVFQAPPETPAAAPRAAKKAAKKPAKKAGAESAPTTDLASVEDPVDQVADPDDVREAAIEEATGARRRRRRGRRGRGGGAAQHAAEDGVDEGGDGPDDLDEGEAAEADGPDGEGTSPSTRRRRRRRRSGAGSADAAEDDPPNTVVHVREVREADDGVKAVKGSTRLEAKRQRRREGRDTGRRRPPILTEAEFLARREAVDRVMAVRQTGDRTQIAVLEDGILVEHYVTRASATSYVGNVYLGRVQNVLPSMEAAFVDIGKGRNGVLYAGEVNWDAAGLEGKARAIEQALKTGDTVLVQVTKDPIGHKGARLTSQVSLPGRFLVYVPGGGMTGISRKLPDTERHRLKAILKKIVPEDAGVIIRTAAEGASEEELTRDVERLKAQWEAISKKAQKTTSAPVLVHGEPDLAIRVVRDVFNEDFKQLVVQGDGAWQTVSDYVGSVAPDLAERVSHHTGGRDLFSELRVDEQILKALDRKVWLPSGGSLVIDRTEAMTVVDVNTGKFVGSGGNLEQTVTRNNLEAAEEIVRQLRLRDVGGIIVIDFIDMVLESNRELVLRRLTECLGRDRTKHQVAEVTSLGLVQMTRKRVGEGLLEAFSEPCEVCKGRGVIIHTEPVDRPSAQRSDDEDERPKSRRKKAAKKAAEPPELSAEELAVIEEQRAAARAAITAIHAATHHDELDEIGEAGETADGGVRRGDEPAEDADGTRSGAATEPDRAAGAAEAIADELVDEVVDEVFGAELEPGLGPEPLDAAADAAAQGRDDADAAEAAPARPRRRRSASRPAGPPVAVG
jgi:ribonuclease E